MVKGKKYGINHYRAWACGDRNPHPHPTARHKKQTKETFSSFVCIVFVGVTGIECARRERQEAYSEYSIKNLFESKTKSRENNSNSHNPPLFYFSFKARLV